MTRYYPYGVVVFVVVALAIFFSIVSCAAPSPKLPAPVAVEKKAEPPKPEPIPIFEPNVERKKIAVIDPTTGKVTYDKNADPKKVVESVIQVWAQTSRELQECRYQLQIRVEKK